MLGTCSAAAENAYAFVIVSAAKSAAAEHAYACLTSDTAGNSVHLCGGQLSRGAVPFKIFFRQRKALFRRESDDGLQRFRLVQLFGKFLILGGFLQEFPHIICHNTILFSLI